MIEMLLELPVHSGAEEIIYSFVVCPQNPPGKTSLQLAQDGYAPYTNDGQKVILHHIGQQDAGPIAEVRQSIHRKYSGILHKSRISEIDRPEFKAWKKRYWTWRSQQTEGVR